MEKLTVEPPELLRKTEDARRRYGAKSQVAPESAGSVARRLSRRDHDDRTSPEKPARIPVLTPEEVLRSREELSRRYAPPPPVRPPAVPDRYLDARFATWEPKGPSIETARKAVEIWVQGVVAGKHMMVALVGPQGTSKSHLLACAAWDLFERDRIRADVFEWFVVADELRNIEAAPLVRRELRAARPLIVDEARPTSNTDFDAIELSKLSMHAYSHKQSVLLATNWSSLEGLMGAPAADRFTVVPVNGPSAR